MWDYIKRKTIAVLTLLMAFLPLILIAMALLAYAIAYLLLDPYPEVQRLAYSMAGAVLAGGTFACLLKTFQYLGVFTDTVKRVFYFEPEFLANQSDLSKIHENVVRAAVEQRYPELAHQISDAMLLGYLPIAGDYYYKRAFRDITVEEFDPKTGTVVFVDRQSLELCAEKHRKAHYTTSVWGHQPSSAIDAKLWIDNVEKAPAATLKEDGLVKMVWREELSGKELYQIRKNSRIRQCIPEDPVVLMVYTHFHETAELLIKCPYDQISVLFEPIGIPDQRVVAVKEDERGHNVRYRMGGLAFPHQGYLLYFCMKGGK